MPAYRAQALEMMLRSARLRAYHRRHVLAPYLLLCVLLCLLLLAVTTSSHAIISDDDESARPPPNDPEYAAGLAAYQRGDWQAVIDTMRKVIAQRPWRDNAHNLLGFAYRKLGEYRRAIDHYQTALDLNPYHRGALEYLGEAYVELGCIDRARALLARLEAVCKRVSGTGNWQAACEEWQDLQALLRAFRGPARSPCTVP